MRHVTENLPFNEHGVIPPILDICGYLAEQGRPVRQHEIIHVVGGMRQRDYPDLPSQYSNVWRALEYFVRHEQRIACVDKRGQPAKFKMPQPSQGLHNDPARYEQDNWFVLRDVMPAIPETH